MFGTYLSPEIVRRMVEDRVSPESESCSLDKVRAISFVYPDWGFSDDSLPSLQELLDQLGDSPPDVSHDGFTVCFSGDSRKAEFERVRGLLESAATRPIFRGFRVGVAEGDSASYRDTRRIEMAARQNAKEPNQPPQPTTDSSAVSRG